jgi:hypothetical protein
MVDSTATGVEVEDTPVTKKGLELGHGYGDAGMGMDMGAAARVLSDTGLDIRAFGDTLARICE